VINVDAGGLAREIASGLDSLFTSDEERAAARLAAQKTAQHPHILQAMTNMEEAKHPSLFVAGWRPALGWLVVFCLAYAWVFRDLVLIIISASGSTISLPEIDTADLMTLVLALLGLGGIRAYEGIRGVKRDNLKAKVVRAPEVVDDGLAGYLAAIGVSVKPGVDTRNIDLNRMGPAIRAAQHAFDVEGVDTVVTSAYRPRDTKSLHSKGLALDFRTRTLRDGRDTAVADAMIAELGHEYQVIVEDDHIHVEYDPR